MMKEMGGCAQEEEEKEVSTRRGGGREGGVPMNWGPNCQESAAKPPNTCPWRSLATSRVGPRPTRALHMVEKLSPWCTLENRGYS